MRKSLVNWIRTIALVAAASTGSFTFASSKAYAHDLPAFDVHGSISCFGIGSCDFAFPSQVDEVSPQASNPEAVIHRSGGSVDSKSTRLDEAGISQLFPVVSPDANLSYPASFLSLIQATGIRIPQLDFSKLAELISTADGGPSIENATEPDHYPKIEESHFSKRTLVDDYLASESFVRQWPSDQSYRGLNRFDHVIRESQEEPSAVAGPTSTQWNVSAGLADLLVIMEEIQCRATQELRDFGLTNKLSQSAGFWLGSAACESAGNSNELLALYQQNAIEEQAAYSNQLSGLPAFVIQKLDGKDFLLPTNQYKLWNEVPAFIGNSDEVVAAHKSDSPIVSDMAIAVSSGLDFVAVQLQEVARKLRSIATDGSQVANRSLEGVR